MSKDGLKIIGCTVCKGEDHVDFRKEMDTQHSADDTVRRTVPAKSRSGASATANASRARPETRSAPCPVQSGHWQGPADRDRGPQLPPLPMWSLLISNDSVGHASQPPN